MAVSCEGLLIAGIHCFACTLIDDYAKDGGPGVV